MRNHHGSESTAEKARGAHVSSGQEALAGLEAIFGSYQSHFLESGRRVSLPLSDRRHPLEEVLARAEIEASKVPEEYDAWIVWEMSRMRGAGLSPFVLT